MISWIWSRMKLSLRTHSVKWSRDSITEDTWKISHAVGQGHVTIHLWKLFSLMGKTSLGVLHFTWALCIWRRVMIKKFPHPFVLWEMAYPKEPCFLPHVSQLRITAALTVHLCSATRPDTHPPTPTLGFISDELNCLSPLTKWENKPIKLSWSNVAQLSPSPETPEICSIFILSQHMLPYPLLPLNDPFQRKAGPRVKHSLTYCPIRPQPPVYLASPHEVPSSLGNSSP